MNKKVTFVPPIIGTDKNGQMLFADVPPARRKAKSKHFIDVEFFLAEQVRCTNCQRVRNLPHNRTGEFVRLKPHYHDGDKSNRTLGNVSFLCQECLKSIPKPSRGGNPATTTKGKHE